MALVTATSGKTATSKGKLLVLENKNLRPRRAPQRTTNAQQDEKSTGKTPPRAQLEPRALTRSIAQTARDEMLDAHMPLVRLVAERIHRRLPPGVDLGSLIHSGIVGLLEALQRYDARRGVAFQTYARYRIQGEIMEYLRSLDWVSRSVRAWGRKMAVARTRLVGRLGREASPEEMASELGVALPEYYRADQKVSQATLLSLEELPLASEEEWSKGQEEFSPRAFQDPFASVEGKDLVQKLAVAIDTLPERERLVVTLYYHEELTLREIGKILSLTESRISQIHTQAVTRLQSALGATEEPSPLGDRRMAQPGSLRLAA
jgi:RNA polymerase sigma factor FliA